MASAALSRSVKPRAKRRQGGSGQGVQGLRSYGVGSIELSL